MTREQLSHIESYTWGAAKVINREGLKYAYNCISAGDGVPLLLNPIHCLAGMFGYGEKMNVHYVWPRNSFWPIDHGFENDTYSYHKNKIFDDIKFSIR